MAKSLLGVEFGNTHIRFVEIHEGKLLKYEDVKTPKDLFTRDGLVASEEGMVDFLKTYRQKGTIRTRKVAMVVPDAGTFTRRLSLPPMTAAQLDINLPYEFRDYITEEKDKYLYDYKMIHLEKDAEGRVTAMNLVAVAARKDMVEKYERLFKMAGYKLVIAVPYYLSLGNLIGSLDEAAENEDYAVLHLGDIRTKVGIFDHGVYDMNRVLENGAWNLAERAAESQGISPYAALRRLMNEKDPLTEDPEILDICEAIAVSVSRSINYYNYQKGEEALKTMYVTGEGVFIKPLFASMERNVPLHLVPLSRKVVSEKAREALIMAPTALGACLNNKEVFCE